MERYYIKSWRIYELTSSLQQPYEASTIIISVLQMGKVRRREVKPFA